MSTVQVRLEDGTDAAGIAAVHSAAFAGAVDTADRPVEVSLVEWLHEDADVLEALSFVAVDAEQIVGHVLCSRGYIGATSAVGLGPLGVLPRWQGRGVGSALMRAVITAADTSGEVAIMLLGDPLFYGRFGFEPALSHGVSAPDVTWADHFQLLRLSMWPPHLAGIFRYAKAFDRLSAGSTATASSVQRG